MSVTLRLATPFRDITGGVSEVDAAAASNALRWILEDRIV